jgi:hypothetical protein
MKPIENRKSFVSRCALPVGIWCALGWVVLAGAAEPLASLPPGPRGPAGPDVPLTGKEEERFAKRVTPEGFSVQDIQAAVDKALKNGPPVVYLGPGLYEFKKDETVTIKQAKGLTVLGAGAKTRLKNVAGPMFLIEGGESVRFTRLKLEGADPTFAKGNSSDAPRFNGGKDHRVDHCEISGFEWGPGFWRGAVGQVDHCVIHNNATSGMGYGVIVHGAKQVLICDNRFWSCRHMVCGNGPNTHYTFRHNHVEHDKDLAPGDNTSCLDAHSGMKGGTIVIEKNLIENVARAVGTWAAAVNVRDNLFKNVRVAVWHTSKEGLVVERNTFEDVNEKLKGVADGAENVVVDGQRLKGPEQPLSFPSLIEIGEEYTERKE